MDSKDILKLKTEFKKKNSLYLAEKDGQPLQFNTKEEFFQTITNINNNGYYTYDAVTGKLHEKNVSFRTLEDLYRICMYYYPRMTLKSLLIYLWSNCSFKVICKQINKRVYREYSSRYGLNSVPGDTEIAKTDEYGWTWRDYRTYVNNAKIAKPTKTV